MTVLCASILSANGASVWKYQRRLTQTVSFGETFFLLNGSWPKTDRPLFVNAMPNAFIKSRSRQEPCITSRDVVVLGDINHHVSIYSADCQALSVNWWTIIRVETSGSDAIPSTCIVVSWRRFIHQANWRGVCSSIKAGRHVGGIPVVNSELNCRNLKIIMQIFSTGFERCIIPSHHFACIG